MRGGSREAGREAVPPKVKVTWRDPRIPAGALSFPSVPLGGLPGLKPSACSAVGFAWGLARRPARPLIPGRPIVLVQHSGTVVSRREPLDGTCPGLPLRWRQDGGAGSSPQITVMTGVPAGETAGDYAGASKGEVQISCIFLVGH